MNKINAAKISYITILALAVLAILTLGVMILPGEASAQSPGYVIPYNATNYNAYPVQRQKEKDYIFEDTYPNPFFSPAPVDQNTSYQNTNTRQVYSTTSATENSAYTENTENQNGGESLGNLAGSAILGEGFQFGLIHWVFFAIIILLIVIIVRKIFGGEDRYHSTPLKHA